MTCKVASSEWGSERKDRATGSECGRSSLPLDLVNSLDLMIQKDVVQSVWQTPQENQNLEL